MAGTTGICGEVLARGGLQGWPLWGDTRGCSRLPTQACNGPTTGKILKKGQKSLREREGGNTEGEMKAWTPGQEEGKEALQAYQQIFPCTHGEDRSGIEIHEGSHTGAGECFLKELQPTLEQVKSVRMKQLQRRTDTWCPQTPSLPAPLRAGQRNSVWKKDEKSSYCNACLHFSQSNSIWSGNKLN